MEYDTGSVAVETVWEAVEALAYRSSDGEQMIADLSETYGVPVETVRSWLAHLASHLELSGDDVAEQLWRLAQEARLPVQDGDELWALVCDTAGRARTSDELVDILAANHGVPVLTVRGQLFELAQSLGSAADDWADAIGQLWASIPARQVTGAGYSDDEKDPAAVEDRHRATRELPEDRLTVPVPGSLEGVLREHEGLADQIAGHLPFNDLVSLSQTSKHAHSAVQDIVVRERNAQLCPVCRRSGKPSGVAGSSCPVCDEKFTQFQVCVHGEGAAKRYKCHHLLHEKCTTELRESGVELHFTRFVSINESMRGKLRKLSAKAMDGAREDDVLLGKLIEDGLLLVDSANPAGTPALRPILNYAGAISIELKIISKGHFKKAGFAGHTAGRVLVWLSEDTLENREQFRKLFAMISKKNVEFSTQRMSG